MKREVDFENPKVDEYEDEDGDYKRHWVKGYDPV